MHSRNSRASAPIMRALLVVTIALSAACDPRRVLEPQAGLQAQDGDETITTCIEGEEEITAGAFTFGTNLVWAVSGDANAVQTFIQDLVNRFGANRQASAANLGTVAANTVELVTLRKSYTTVKLKGTDLVNGHEVAYEYSYRESGYWVLSSREVVEKCPEDEDPQGVLG